MNNATRTTEGLPSQCPVCGKRMSVAPGEPLGDVVCPHCGMLFYPKPQSPLLVPDDLKRLADLGASVETDDEGEVTRITFDSFSYTDSAVPELAKLKGVPIIDIRHTRITEKGANRLRALLPDAIIEH
ncbi:MAG: hypothetical protein JWN70_6595 [Planctomycetaceae bacterium]|nr:hypothetical protein [Planctomycetaceae bacterium]